MKALLLCALTLAISGCAVFGEEKGKYETAPYKVVEAEQAQQIELRTYPQMILASTSMAGDNRNGAFRKLFNYISGDNEGSSKISMTTPVFMDKTNDSDENESNEGIEISMTTPVFMDNDKDGESVMSFVLPDFFTMENAPKPTNPDVKLSEVKDYSVAAITFSGTLSDSNVKKHRILLEQWITEKNLKITGEPKMAGYNAPFTLPAFRRNEVLIPVEMKK